MHNKEIIEIIKKRIDANSYYNRKKLLIPSPLHPFNKLQFCISK